MQISKWKYGVVIALCFVANVILAHDIDMATVLPRQWTFNKGNKNFEGYFYMYKNGNVYIDVDNKIVNYPLNAFCKEDQNFTLKKDAYIRKVNNDLQVTQLTVSEKEQQNKNTITLLLVFAGIAVVGWSVQSILTKKHLPYAYCTLAIVSVAGSLAFSIKNYRSVKSVTSPYFMDSAFTPFKPAINTSWDANYFYVESKGIPNHGMMTGITKWQQQVPIPQCYTGTNAWSIPLNPTIAASPVPVNQNHFLRGAVAIAANGVAIFNPYTNTGVDALVDGQLDNWGGHCGRADDYHYHIAPLSLYSLGQTPETLPCAFALDGFAVYGSKEPDGSNMAALDTCHGHYGSNGVYHYHGTTAAPYMIGYMVGAVTEDATLQIVPQAAAKPVRPSLTPLTGATITACVPNGTNNGYNLTYTKSGQNYNVNYSWTTNVYTYNFISPTSTTTSTYNGFTQCAIVTPLKLLNFNAIKNNTTIKLDWSTTNEVNTKVFEVERSNNNITWRSIGTVAAKNMMGTNTYSFIDESKPTNTVYYRLKCMDIDGKFTYSTVKKIEMSNAANGIKIYPNPATDYINIELLNTLTAKDVLDIAVYTTTGNKVFQSSSYLQKINTNKWAKGVYTIAVKTTQQTISKKIIVE
jgi:hypothetical protein